MTADHRATALLAACTWLSGVDPFPQGRDFVLATADVFAAWLESHGCDSPAEAARSAAEANPGGVQSHRPHDDPDATGGDTA